jgi:outer membrane immunogenic protein
MRRVICALAMLMSPAVACAADLDLDVLRGSESVGPALFTKWSGFYFGGQAGYSNVNTDFSHATSSLVAFSLRELALEQQDSVSTWPVLGNSSNSAVGYGGFVGYNTQWQDLILGLEANYTYANITSVATESPIARQTSAGGNSYDVTVAGTATLRLIDYSQLRARAGWVFNNFLPYGFVGVAIGRSDYSISSLVFGQQNPSSPPIVPCNTAVAPNCVDFSYSNSAGQNSALMYGFSVGGGLDVALTPNMFVRGEFEYVRFAPLADITVAVTSARVGAGFKF